MQITTVDPVTAPERFAAALAAGDVRVRTLGETLGTYGQRPEHKSLAPDGSPAGATTVGLLGRRPVRSSPVRTHLAGKEGNKLLERLTGVVTDSRDYRTDYGTRAEPWAELVVPVLRRMGAVEVARRTDARWRRAIERVIEDGHNPRQAQRAEALIRVAADYAREVVGQLDVVDDVPAMRALLASAPAPPRRLCACGCGLSVASQRARWFSEAHRKRAGRQPR